MDELKSAYVCGPLTDLPSEDQKWVKKFYEDIAEVALEVLGVRGFVPHEHCDPVLHAHMTSPEVDAVERPQVCFRTSILIACPTILGSWGGGIEVEMTNGSGGITILVCEQGKKVSRLLKGNPSVREVILYDSLDDALDKLREALRKYRYATVPVVAFA